MKTTSIFRGNIDNEISVKSKCAAGNFLSHAVQNGTFRFRGLLAATINRLSVISVHDVNLLCHFIQHQEIFRIQRSQTLRGIPHRDSREIRICSRFCYYNHTNIIVTSLYKNVVKYVAELEVGNEESVASSYLFTSNLKELSGAVLHKTVFAFRLAYITAR